MANFNPTRSTWGQVANKQAYDEFNSGALNSATLPVLNDPIYSKLIEQISRTIYHKLQVMQKWSAIGITSEPNSYPGIVREILMLQRKGKNFAMDRDVRPTTLLNYDIIDDNIEVRYHSAQFRWMYGYTIFDAELRRFSGGNGSTIAQLTESKQINSISARNMFIDNLRKKMLSVVSSSVAVPYETDIDISDFNNLTSEDARQWLNAIDMLLWEFDVGSAKYNTLEQYIQTPKSQLQVVIPKMWYSNVIRRAFPDMLHTQAFENILPENLILIDTMGDDMLTDTGVEILPTFDAQGMNLLNWNSASEIAPRDSTLQCLIYDKRIMSFEDNLSEVLVGTKDIEKLATPVRSHYWTKAWFTDLLPCVKVVFNG